MSFDSTMPLDGIGTEKTCYSRWGGAPSPTTVAASFSPMTSPARPVTVTATTIALCADDSLRQLANDSATAADAAVGGSRTPVRRSFACLPAHNEANEGEEQGEGEAGDCDNKSPCVFPYDPATGGFVFPPVSASLAFLHAEGEDEGDGDDYVFAAAGARGGLVSACVVPTGPRLSWLGSEEHPDAATALVAAAPTGAVTAMGEATAVPKASETAPTVTSGTAGAGEGAGAGGRRWSAVEELLSEFLSKKVSGGDGGFEKTRRGTWSLSIPCSPIDPPPPPPLPRHLCCV